MKRMNTRQALLVFWVFVLSIGIPERARSQDPQPALAPSQQELGQKAIKFVADRFAIDAAIPVPKTSQPLSGKGNWFISKEPPAICTKISLPCLQLSYTEPGTDVHCQWTMTFGSQDGLLLDLNEDAARYFTTKPRQGNQPTASPKPEWVGGKRISSVPPVYPEIAKTTHLQGDVKLLVRFDATRGRPADIQVISGPPLLRNSAVDCVQQWVYTPLTIDAVPLSTRNLVVIGFHMR